MAAHQNAESPPHTLRAFSSETTSRVLSSAGKVLGLDVSDGELIRLGENALYRLTSEHVVIRVARTMDYWKDAEKEVAVARWLASHGLPATQTADVGPQPVEVDGYPVTVWRLIEGGKPQRDDVALLGRVLRRLHALPPPTDFQLPEMDILGRVEPRIQSSTVADADKEFLLDLLADLRSELLRVRYALGSCAVHGDAHNGNLMLIDGEPVLIDLERFAWGQAEWDLARTATEYVTAGFLSAGRYREFSDAYGFDVTESESFSVLRAVTELKMVTWLMQRVDESEAIAGEFAKRMRTLRADGAEPWRPF
jgi:Ser/Thr protein kinase RdoA (MazF antagonist)